VRAQWGRLAAGAAVFVVVLGLIWLFWPEIKERPGAEQVVDWAENWVKNLAPELRTRRKTRLQENGRSAIYLDMRVVDVAETELLVLIDSLPRRSRQRARAGSSLSNARSVYLRSGGKAATLATEGELNWRIELSRGRLVKSSRPCGGELWFRFATAFAALLNGPRLRR
jgi:hypothetical protein